MTVDSLLQDLRAAVRALSRMRSAASVAILTLALGIGATSTVFSVVYAALIRPLPFDRSDRLVALYTTRTSRRAGFARLRWSMAEIRALGSSMTTLESVASFTSTSVNLTSDGDPEQLFGEIVSPPYLHLLRVSPFVGRDFTREDDEGSGEHAVVLIGARLWHRRLGTDPAIVGRTLWINQRPLTIVGVLPDGFAGLSGRAELWLPTSMAPRLTYEGYLTTPQHFINLVGRLTPAATAAQADAEVSAMAPRVVAPEISATDPAVWSAAAVPLSQARIDGAQERSSLLLLAAVACLLLITCANVACILLARARGRRREIGIRMAIGCGRSRLVRQLLTESLLLAAVGGIGGIALAAWSVDILALPAVIATPRNDYAQLSAFAAPRLDGVVLLFAAAVTLGTSLLFGLAPAAALSRPDVIGALKEDDRTAAGAGPVRLLAPLVVTEIALAVLLVGCAGLLIKSVDELQTLRTGFVPERVLTFWVSPPASRYAPADGPAIVERVLDRVQNVPGVVSAAVNRCTPFTGCARTVIHFPGENPVTTIAPVVGRHYASADYFRTIGIPLVSGRLLTDADRAGRPPVTVVDETAARRFWPGENPIGKRVWFGSGTGFTDPSNPVEVVGVVGDVKYGALDEPRYPNFYTSYLQFAYPDTMVIVKTSAAASTLVPSLRSAVSGVDAGLPIYDIQSLDDRIARELARPRFNASAVALFAGSALLLAGLGVYGVMAYSVSFRVREIGIRLALGADSGTVIRLILGEGTRLAAAGAGVGIIAALVAGRIMRSLLFGVAPDDPAVLGISLGIILAVALTAAFLPARRASTVDPMLVLRSE